MTKGLPLHFHEYGDRSGSPVLFLHGFLGSGVDWAPTAALLPDYRCLCPDLPGHGADPASAGLRGCNMEASADRIVSLLDRLGIETASLVGYSMGGRLALYLALRHAKRFDRIVLESASPGLPSDEAREERRKHDEELAARLVATPLDTFLREWYAQPLFATLAGEPGRVEALIEGRREFDREGLADSLRSMGTGSQRSLWGELKALERPTLLITGSEDAKFCEIARQMMTRCPAAQWSVAEGAGHNVHLERNEEYARRLARFLNA